MKIFLMLILLLTSLQANATGNTSTNYGVGYANSTGSYQHFLLASQALASRLLKNTSETELSLDMLYRASTPTEYLVFVNRVTQERDASGIYQRGYQYVCRKSRRIQPHRYAEVSLCGEANYSLAYRPRIKKAL